MANTIHFPPEKTAKHLFDQYISTRGITKETVKACELTVASRDVCLDRLGHRFPTNYTFGIIIPYDEHYATVRWLGDNTTAFGTNPKEPKMLAPKDTCRVYTPPLPACSGENFSGTVYLCESALKAVVLAQAGYYAIAGNGVWGIYTNSGFSEGFPTGLFESGVERAVILFDSDWATNAKVSAAIRKLATGLANNYPDLEIVHKALSADADGENWGIDDAVHSQGEEWLHEWLASSVDELKVEISPLQRHLDELNEEYVVCAHPISVIRQSTGMLYSKANFTDMLEAVRNFMVRGDSGRMAKVLPPKEWLEWPDRNLVEKLVYSPGKAMLEPGVHYNSWKDDGVCAADGDITPFLAVYRNAIPDDDVRALLFESMAWMLQNRGKKLDKTFLLVGSQVGTGKSMLAQTMGKLVGRSNYSSIGVEDFTSDFNGSFVNKEIVLLDDLYKLGKAPMAKLKRYITDETLMVNQKHLTHYEVDNHAVYFITSNEFVSLPMDNNERRVLTVEFAPVVHHPTGSVWWKDYVGWLGDPNKEGSGYSKIRAWLEGLDLNGEVDSTGRVITPPFDPNYMPPMTEAKAHIIQSTQAPEEAWANDLYNNVDEILHMTKRSVFTPAELWQLYTGGGDSPTRAEGIVFGQAVGKWFKKFGKGKVVKVDGRVDRYWIIRGVGKDWTNAAVAVDVKKYPSFTPR